MPAPRKLWFARSARPVPAVRASLLTLKGAVPDLTCRRSR